MIEVHDLLATHGLEKARELVTDKRQRQRLEAAATVPLLGEEHDSLAICHAGPELTNGSDLWHKRTNQERLGATILENQPVVRDRLAGDVVLAVSANM